MTWAFVSFAALMGNDSSKEDAEKEVIYKPESAPVTCPAQSEAAADVSSCPIAARFKSFRLSLRGKVITLADADYETERRVWNADVNRKPALIVKCKVHSRRRRSLNSAQGAHDVRLAIAYARELKLRVTIRGGGHNFCGYSVADDCMMIDLAEMRSVRVNPEKRTVRVGGGCKLRDIDRETTPHNLAVPFGCVSLTGIGGLALGGGVGWLTPLYGLACQNILEADLITADGKQLQVTAESDPELFFALRGGGNGNFGVVTSFKFRLHPLPQPIHIIAIEFLLEKTAEMGACVLRMIGEGRIPNYISPYIFIGNSPPSAAIIGTALCTAEEFRSVMAPLYALGPIRELKPSSWSFVNSMTDKYEYPGQMIYCKSAFIRTEVLADPAPLMSVVMTHWKNAPDERGLMIGIELFWRGAFEILIEKGDCAFPHRGARASILFNAHIPNPGLRNDYIRWCRTGVEVLKEFSVPDAVYCNYAPPEVEKEKTFPVPTTLERVKAVKQRLDPDGLFIGYLDKVINPLYPK